VRRLGFGFEDVEKYFFDGQPAMTFFLLGMAAYFPDGEQFFIDSVRHYRDRVTDPQLQRDIGAFIGQEAMHGREHRVINETFEAMGVPVRRIERWSKWMFRGLQRSLGPKSQLAMTVALEHFTAIMGKQMLRNRSYAAAFEDQRALHLVMWHAIEECEHKSIAIDTYLEVGGGYWRRVITMALVTPFLAFSFGGAQVFLMYRDGQLGNLRSWWHCCRALFGLKGLFTPILGDYLSFYSPGFHPSQHDTSDLERQWRGILGL